MKKQLRLSVLLTVLMSMIGAKAFAYDFAVENEDGITIYYNYINDGKELEVTYCGYDINIGHYRYYHDDVVIPEEVTYMNRTRKVTAIGDNAFSENEDLNSVTIPNSVKSIGAWAFSSCFNFTFISIPNSVISIGDGAFSSCWNLTSISIPNSVISIGDGAFSGCKSLTSLTIPESVASIGKRAFLIDKLVSVVSQIENPIPIYGASSNDRTFSLNTYYNVTLYVPVGSINKYKTTEGWKDFMFIEEGTGPGGDTPSTQKCSKPTISYKNGKLTFNCDTEGATCQYSITDDDIRSGNGYEVQLGVTYNISVYATKAGYDDSDKATATLCWIDVEPRTEGITNVAQVRAQAVMIQSSDGVLSISGVDDGQIVSVYSVSGQIMGTSKASNNQATIATNLKQGEIAIVKIGEKSVKVVIQ